jgi:hypothetical protein
MSSAASAVPATEGARAEDVESSAPDLAQECANGKDHSFEPMQVPLGVHSEISRLAYSLWCQRGCPDGSPEVDWFAAEQKFREG